VKNKQYEQHYPNCLDCAGGMGVADYNTALTLPALN